MPSNIFVSYSHTDSPLVAPIVSLLRASNAFVFRDADSIRPGKRWRDEIGTAIHEASIVVVFWCHHASTSQEVRKEYNAAIAQGKDVLPLLLDETPLPGPLDDFQYIDFREAFGNAHGVEPALREVSWKGRGPHFVWYAGIAGAVGIAAMGYLYVRAFSSGPLDATGLWLPASAVGFVLFLALLLRRLMRNRPVPQDRAAGSRSSDGFDETRVAQKIEAELIRRSGPSTA